MGHFGQKPIRAGWGTTVVPALILNYLGQGAWALAQPAAEFTHGFNPFFNMAPNWAQYPAGRRSRRWPRSSPRRRSSSGRSRPRCRRSSCNYLPRMRVEHTSDQESGQI
jgi:KUP system potassium uptake protein